MKFETFCISLLLFSFFFEVKGQQNINPADVKFVRQGVKRFIFEPDQDIPLSGFDPATVIGIASMYPVNTLSKDTAKLELKNGELIIASGKSSETTVWMGGFNPFATYSLQWKALKGNGAIGFEFVNQGNLKQFQVLMTYFKGKLTDIRLKIIHQGMVNYDQSIRSNPLPNFTGPGNLIVQMLGSGLTVFIQKDGLPMAVGQSNFNSLLDLRNKNSLHQFCTRMYFKVENGEVAVRKAQSAISTGMGQADIRAITYKDGSPLLDQGRIWYTVSIRGRALDQHVQGIFSMNPSVFDIKLEGIVVFDRADGLLRNDISSHIYYDDDEKIWRGFTTGFTYAANPQSEKKQIWAIESRTDPRFGFSIMKATPTNIIGDIEDSHVFYDKDAKKWRILTCENNNGYKAIIMESATWDGQYTRIAGPVTINSTGTSMQKFGNQWHCFFGSADRKIYIYSYPDLKPEGILNMDLPPWDKSSETRVWPNIVALPDGYPVKYVALMMDRYNYPGLAGPNWSYGALYLYHAIDPFADASK